ncbi:unnamed protein product [Closterium sp. NIES-64]|nr:unnamed protein product [Closterium sp. NIES-64]
MAQTPETFVFSPQRTVGMMGCDCVGRWAGGVEWNAVAPNILIGTTPRDQAALEALATRAGVNAVLCVEEGGARQEEWARVAERAQAMGMVAVSLALADVNQDEQDMALPRAISAVDLLLSRGYTVHVCCSSGNDKAPLVALGYLTLVRGQAVDGALAALKAVRPSINPYMLPWEKVRDPPLPHRLLYPAAPHATPSFPTCCHGYARVLPGRIRALALVAHQAALALVAPACMHARASCTRCTVCNPAIIAYCHPSLTHPRHSPTARPPPSPSAPVPTPSPSHRSLITPCTPPPMLSPLPCCLPSHAVSPPMLSPPPCCLPPHAVSPPMLSPPPCCLPPPMLSPPPCCLPPHAVSPPMLSPPPCFPSTPRHPPPPLAHPLVHPLARHAHAFINRYPLHPPSSASPREQLRDSLSAGDSKRVLQLTQEEFRRRLAAKEGGTHANDWQVALARVAADRFRHRLAADHSLVHQLCQVGWGKGAGFGGGGGGVLWAGAWAAAEAAGGARGGPGSSGSSDEVRSLKMLLEGANSRVQTADAAAAAAKDRIDFFFRQVTALKAREEAARKQARVAERRVEALLRELDEQRRRAAEDADRQAEERRRDVQAGRVQALTAEEAGELVGRVVELEGLLSQTRAALQAATDRNEFFLRQLSAIRESEKKSRTSARAADRRYFAILRRVEELGRKEASAKQVAEEAQRRYESMASELQGLGSVGDIKERLEELNSKVAELKRKEAQAEAATRAALERVAVLSEQLEEAAAREAEIRDSERTARERADALEVRVDALVSDLQAAKAAAATAERSVGEISKEVAKLREREAAADEAIRRYEAVSGQLGALQARDAGTRQEIDAANRRIGLLSEQIVNLTRRETELQEALQTANDHISFLSTRVSELIEREEEAKAQAQRADARVAELHSEVAAVQQREAVAVREAEAASRKLALVEESEAAAVEAAMRANARVEELFRQVEDVEQREAAAKAAAKAAYERLAEMSERLAAAEERSAAAERGRGGAGQRDSAAPWDAAVVFDSRTAEPVPVRSSPSSASSVNGTALPPSSFIAQQLSPPTATPASPPQTPQEREEQRRVEEEVEETRRALGATVDECVGLFLGQVAALREREQASKQALAAANQRIEELSTQVALLAAREDAANAEAEAFAGQVTGLVMRIADLNEELEAAERREAELADALTAGGSGGGLPGLLKQDPQKLIAELEAARRRADELAAEVEEARRTAEDISESIFNARKKSLQEQQQREELVAEVLSLKEAMEAMRERDEAIAVWKQQLAEQAEYLDSLMAEGQVDQSQRDMLRAAVREIQLGSGDQAFSAV